MMAVLPRVGFDRGVAEGILDEVGDSGHEAAMVTRHVDCFTIVVDGNRDSIRESFGLGQYIVEHLAEANLVDLDRSTLQNRKVEDVLDQTIDSFRFG